jgi:hypothetical protein
MNGITGYMAEISQNLENSGLLWLAALICIIILLLLAWLLLRRFRLWYWKVDVHIDTLKNIDKKLKNLEEGIIDNAIFAVETQIEEAIQENENVNVSENVSESETQNVEQMEPTYIKSKMGRIYTEEELEELIKD